MFKCFVRVDKLYMNFYLNVLRKNHFWSSDKVVKSPCKELIIPNVCVHEYMWNNLDKWSNKYAMICGLTNRRYTYKQLFSKSQVLGAKLRKSFQIKDGDNVAIMLPNMPEYPIAVLGILTAGATVSTLNPVYTAHELQRLLQISNPKAIFVVNETACVVKEALKLIKRDLPIIAITIDDDLPQGTVRFSELTDDANVDLSILKEVRTDPNEVAFLLYSSGTTGLPKGVELTHRNLVANYEQQNTEQKLYVETTESHQDSQLVVLPMFHSYGLNILCMHKLSVGLQCVSLPRFHPDSIGDVLAKHQFHLMYLAPPIVLSLGSNPNITKKHFERLRCVICAAAPLPQPDMDRFLEKTFQEDLHFGQGYGLTETGPLATMSPIGFKNYNSVGFAIPNVELRVVDGNGNNLGPNEAGELFIKGPNIMKGYINNPEATKGAFAGDWFKSGDLASIDQDGAVFILDRLKELIKVSGFQVPPAELESVVKEHPSVFDAAVVGVKDPKSGERPRACIVLKKGSKADREDIIKFVNGRVAPYKKIKEIVFLDAIPKNPSGKILRRILLEKLS